MPEPMSMPMRSVLAAVTSSPEERMACIPATTPYCMKASMRRASLGVMYGARSRSRISPPKWVGKLAASNRTTGPMPLRPARIDAHADAMSLPTGETIPRPVTTTLRLLKLASSGLAFVRIDVIDGLLDGRDLLRVLVRYLRLELFFERHHQLNRVQRVCAEVVNERGVIGYFFFFHAQLFGHDLLNLLLNSTHRYGVLSGKPIGKTNQLCRFSSRPAASLISAGRVFYVNRTPAATGTRSAAPSAQACLDKPPCFRVVQTFRPCAF